MSLQRNYYEVLGVPHGATADEIKKKYRDLARKFHPDVVKDKALGQKVFTQINQAYHVLGDPDRRAEYDQTLNADLISRVANGTMPQTGGYGAPRPNGTTTVPAPPPLNTGKMMMEAEGLIAQGNLPKAALICDKVLEAEPRNVRALDILGDHMAQIGEKQKAIDAYRRALAVQPSVMIQSKLSRLTGSNGNGSTPKPPPTAAARPANGTTARPAPPEAKPAGGLFSRLMGKK